MYLELLPIHCKTIGLIFENSKKKIKGKITVSEEIWNLLKFETFGIFVIE